MNVDWTDPMGMVQSGLVEPALPDGLAQIAAEITEQRWLALARALIVAGQPASENPLDPDMPPGCEAGISEVVAAKLTELGLAVEPVSKRAGRPNVIGTLAGATAGGPTLILNDHLDTYPAGDPVRWTKTGGDPFRPTREGDFLYARGTSDTRGNLACTLLAVEAIRRAGINLRGTLKCVYTVDEEKNGPDGSIFLLDEHGLRADYEITCEPTGWTRPDGMWGMDIGVANAGHFLVEIEMQGIKTHIWRPDTGTNAISEIAALITALEQTPFTFKPARLPGGTPPMLTPVRIGGGVPGEMQFTPDRCSAVFAVVGLVPGMTQESVLADIDARVRWFMRQRSGGKARLRPFPGALFVTGTLELSPDAEPAAAIARAYRQILGAEPRTYRKNAFNDTIRFAERGVPSVTFGPGEDGWPPFNEYIRIGKAVAATKILALALVDILGRAP
jgi:acetylornithine deacetylase/succinyl-diaminopimelate desuccinylase-like protein